MFTRLSWLCFLLDLLQKSLLVEFKVVNCGDQIEAQIKSFSAVPIPFTQDAKHFQLAKYMFNQNPSASQCPISLLLSFRQSVIFGFLERRLTVFVKVCQALITRIRQNAKVFRKFTAIFLEQLKVVLASIGKGGGNNFSRLWIRNYLRFLRMAPLFAAVMLFLAFFGRSIGCSLASTSTTSKTVSLTASAFFPGRTNFPERTRAFSTFWIVRDTVDSLIP